MIINQAEALIGSSDFHCTDSPTLISNADGILKCKSLKQQRKLHCILWNIAILIKYKYRVMYGEQLTAELNAQE